MYDNIKALFNYQPDNLLAAGHYSTGLVVLSVSIAILASVMGFQVAALSARSNSFVRRHASLGIASLALGSGVWSMHFIGMLAIDLCTDVSYGQGITIISILPAIIASWIALNLITRQQLRIRTLLTGGVLVGLGIGSMHYIGMAAMEMAPLLRYDMTIFVLSIIVAVLLSMLSLWIRFGIEKLSKYKRISQLRISMLSGAVMGIAISGMHYTGMAAARFVKPPGLELVPETGQTSSFLAISIAIITVFIICLVLVTSLLFKYIDSMALASANERRLRATMDTAIDGIITINANGIINGVNAAVCSLLGWREDELIDQNVSLLMPEPFKSQHNDYLSRYLKTREAKIIGSGREVEALHKDGRLIPVHLGLGHIELDNEHMFVAFMSDLRERLKMESALKENEARFRSILTNISGISYRCLLTDGWPNIFISNGVEDMLGYPAEDFLLPNPKRYVYQFLHPDDVQQVTESDLTNPDGFTLEYRVIDRFGNVKWVLGKGKMVNSDDRREQYLDGFIVDITHRKEMEQALRIEKDRAEQAAASRAAFLANMSHEIRTPMNAIVGFSEILLDDELSEKQRKHLGTINQSAKSLMHILNDILDSAKLDKGKLDLEYRDFSLINEVDAVISTFWVQSNNNDIQIKLHISQQIPGYFYGAPDRIRQVLTNIVGNAVKFTEQGQVDVHVELVERNHVAIIVRDTGIGMSPEQVDTVFNAFAQADESMNRRFGGTGLGTTISKQLVELMGGTISVESKLGVGSTFTINLPLKPKQDRDTPASILNKKLPPLDILIVDDIEQNIELLSILLERDNHHVRTARNGEQALIRMRGHKFDIVLMDIQMPVMDGLSAAKIRRESEQEEALAHQPIIALTASVLKEDRIAAKSAGIEGFANKPVDMALLNQEIARVLGIELEENNTAEPQQVEDVSIDEKSGIKLWGSLEILYQEISKFLSQTDKQMSLLSDPDSDLSDILSTTHSLRGVAGNLSLVRLTRRLKECEEEAQQSGSIDAKTLNLITLEMNLLREQVNAMRLGEEPDRSPVLTADLVELQNTLEKIIQLAHKNELDDDLVLSLMSHNSHYEKDIKKALSKLEDFEFEAAISIMQTIKDDILRDL